MNTIGQNPNFTVANSKSLPLKKAENTHAVKNNGSENYAESLNLHNRYLVNFTGLNRTVSKTVYQSANSIKQVIETYPKSQGIVGNLPFEWVEKIPKAERQEKIKGLYQDFKSIVNDFRENDNIEEASKKLNSALTKAGIIGKGENLELKKLGDGRLGTGYLLQGAFGDNLIIKTFKTPHYIAEAETHGNYIEINRAAYWQKNAGKGTQMLRFYFGDNDAGYMVTKYLTKETPVCKKYIAPEKYGMKSSDIDETDFINGHNKISGFQIDYGGMDILNPTLVRNKDFQKTIGKILTASGEQRQQLIKNADEAFKKWPVHKLHCLPEAKRIKYFKQMAKIENKELKKELANSLYCLPKAKRFECFRLLAKDSNIEIKKTLVRNIYCIPESQVTSCFKLLAKDADAGLKKALAAKIGYLPESNRALWFRSFSENSDAEMKKILEHKIYYLKESDQKTACRLLEN